MSAAALDDPRDPIEEHGRVAGVDPHQLGALPDRSGGRHVPAVAHDASLSQLHVVLAITPGAERIDQAGIDVAHPEHAGQELGTVENVGVLEQERLSTHDIGRRVERDDAVGQVQ